MAIEITMPKLGLSMVTGKVGKWLSQEGTPINKGEALLEIMTDKIANVVEAPADGVLLKIVAKEGEDLPIGSVLGYMGTAGEKIPDIDNSVRDSTGSDYKVEAPMPVSRVESAAISSEKMKVSPVARKIAFEKGIDLSGILGTGPSGRITKEDVEKAIGESQPLSAAPGKNSTEDSTATQTQFVTTPYSGMRKVIGDNLAHSWAVAPKVDYHSSVDVSALLALKKSINEERGDKITITDMLVKISARALKMRPHINVSLDGDYIRSYREPAIGVAVALDNGLVVPVIKDADTKTLSDISREIKQLAERAKSGQLGMEEMRGGTFTVTNVGSYNSVDWFTPIINQPESAILGIGRTTETPVVIDGQLAIRPMMGISLSFDHRVIDGTPAADFLGVILRLIEKPYLAFV